MRKRHNTYTACRVVRTVLVRKEIVVLASTSTKAFLLLIHGESMKQECKESSMQRKEVFCNRLGKCMLLYTLNCACSAKAILLEYFSWLWGYLRYFHWLLTPTSRSGADVNRPKLAVGMGIDSPASYLRYVMGWYPPTQGPQ